MNGRAIIERLIANVAGGMILYLLYKLLARV